VGGRYVGDKHVLRKSGKIVSVLRGCKVVKTTLLDTQPRTVWSFVLQPSFPSGVMSSNFFMEVRSSMAVEQQAVLKCFSLMQGTSGCV
jgi:hypothetical protein